MDVIESGSERSILAGTFLFSVGEHCQSLIIEQFALACQRLYRSLAVDERTVDSKLVEDLLDLSSFSSSTVFDQLEPFFDYLSRGKQLKLIKLLIKQIIENPQ